MTMPPTLFPTTTTDVNDVNGPPVPLSSWPPPSPLTTMMTMRAAPSSQPCHHPTTTRDSVSPPPSEQLSLTTYAQVSDGNDGEDSTIPLHICTSQFFHFFSLLIIILLQYQRPRP